MQNKFQCRPIWFRLTAIILATAATAVTSATAAGGALVSISTLTNRAEVIVVGRIVQATFVNGTFAATVVVQKCLKGSILPGSSVTVATKLNFSGVGPAPAIVKERGMFFLQHSDTGTWQALPLVSGSTVTIRSAYVKLDALSQPRGASVQLTSPMEQVLAEVIGSLEASDDTSGSPVDLATDFELMKTPTPGARALLANLALSPRDRLRKVALHARLLQGEVATLNQLRQKSPNMKDGEIAEAASMLERVRIADPGAVPTLAALALAGQSD